MIMYNTNNIFAKIIRKEIPAEIIYEDSSVLAIKDINPHAKIHVLVMPKAEFKSLHDFAYHQPEMIANFWQTLDKIACQLGLDSTGYRIISNHGADANQTVEHFHVHLLGGEQLSGF